MKPAFSTVLLMLSFLLLGACGGGGEAEPDLTGAPSDVVAEPLGSGCHLTWRDNSDDESGFQIVRRTATQASLVLTTVEPDATLFHDALLERNETYFYKIVALTPGGKKSSPEVKYVQP